MGSLKNIFNFIVVLLFSLSITSQVFAQNKFSVGVVPQFTPQFIYQSWGPVLQEISFRSGYSFELKIKESITEFEKALLKGEFDFAFMGPYHMVMAKKAKNYEPLIRDSMPLKVILVVRKENEVSSKFIFLLSIIYPFSECMHLMSTAMI